MGLALGYGNTINTKDDEEKVRGRIRVKRADQKTTSAQNEMNETLPVHYTGSHSVSGALCKHLRWSDHLVERAGFVQH